MFATGGGVGVVETGGEPWAACIFANFEKDIIRGQGENYSWEKPEAKYLVALSL